MFNCELFKKNSLIGPTMLSLCLDLNNFIFFQLVKTDVVCGGMMNDE